MAIKEPSFTLGIEEEYLLVDKDSRDLRPSRRRRCSPSARKRWAARSAREFLRSQIEVGTSVCKSMPEARDQLVHLRGTVGRIADEFGLAPIAASTHPFAEWWTQQHTDKERYNVLAKDLQHVARRLVICGMHVHVGIEDDELRIDLLNQASLFPAASAGAVDLLAVLAGRADRPQVLPPVGVRRAAAHRPPASIRELERVSAHRRAAGQRRADRGRHQDVVGPAPLGALSDARDAHHRCLPAASRTRIAIAALYRCILRMLYRLRRQNQRWRHYPPFLVRENRWRAQRYGIEQGLVDFGKGEIVPFATLLEELFDLVAEDAAYFGCVAEMAHARTIVARGTSADRQLARYDAVKKLGGSEQAALVAVVDGIMEETLMPPAAKVRAETVKA